MTPPSTQPAARGDELKRALLALRDMRRRVEELEARGREPIAIIGMACRLPGGADTTEKFWSLLRDGVDATTEVPKDRWDADAIYDPDPEAIGKAYVKRGGFLREPVDRFDPGFFGISPRETSAMDPIHRMLLELAWESLENAGIPHFSLENTVTGVFTGLSSSDYDLLQRGGLDSVSTYRGTGTLQSVASGRISFTLGLQGPNFVVDTACSSGLTALVQAVHNLRSGRCQLALVGSAQLMLDPIPSVFLCKMRALSADGRCHTFDASGTGYARGEGGGMVVLKRLADAQAAGDRILGVIRGAACNHDGRSSGLTVPNPAAQQAVIEAALHDAGLDASRVGYVECHGTATPLGDPIELRALTAALCRERGKDRPLLLGSAKTNFGHLEPAAGIAGVIKAVLALSHRQIPPHLHLTTPTPHVDWASLPVQVPTTLSDWPEYGHPRIAGVSAFGFSGTNAHILIEEPPARPVEATRPARPVELLALSGRSRAAVSALAGRYRERLADADDGLLSDLATTSTAGRSHMPYRAAACGTTPAEIDAALAAIMQDPAAHVSQTRSAGPGPIAFLFTGQGAQYPGMARELAETAPAFRAALERCAEILRPHLDRPLLPLLLDESEGEALHQTAYTQPALFAIEYALAMLWRSWGISPSYVIGHSLGEYVAATIAGVMDLEEALPLVALRGRLMQALPAGGRMVSVFAPEEQVRAALAGESGVTIAAVNGPANCVISGAGESVATVLRRLAPAKVRTSELKVSHAFHSPAMDPILAPFEDAIRKLKLRAPRLGLVSNLTGTLLTAAEATDPARWRRHIREAVRFGASIARLGELGVRCFVEVGPHPVLTSLGRETITTSETRWLPSLRRGVSAWKQIEEGVAALYRAGCEIDWAGWCRDYRGSRAEGPLYPFQRERYWFTDFAPEGGAAATAATTGGIAGTPATHPLLGASIQSPAIDGWAFQLSLSSSHPGYLADHRIQGHVIVPGAMYVEMMLAAAREGPAWPQARITNLTFERPLVVNDSASVPCQVLVGAVRDGRASLRVVSGAMADGATRWTTHATGTLEPLEAPASSIDSTLASARATATASVDAAQLYARLEQRGINYGPAFRPLREIWIGEGQAVGRVLLADGLVATNGSDLTHPCMLDAGFQILGSLSGASDDATATFLPAGIDSVQFLRPGGKSCWVHGATRPQSDADLALADITFYDADGHPIAILTGFRARRVKGALAQPAAAAACDPVYRIDWQPVDMPALPSDVAGTWILLDDDSGTGRLLAQALARRGARCIRVRRGETAARDGDLLTIDPAETDLWARIAEAAGHQNSRASIRGVVHLWTLDGRSSESATAEELTRRVLDCCMPAVTWSRTRPSGEPGTLSFVTRGAAGPDGAASATWDEGCALWGLLPIIQAEHPEISSRAIDLDPGAETFAPDQLASLILGQTTEDRLALRGSQLFAPRLARPDRTREIGSRRTLPTSEAYRIDIEKRGTLDALRYVPLERVAPKPGEVEVRIRATGLNFRDVLNTLGMYPGDPGPPGVEFAGLVTRIGPGVTHVKPGDEVMGIGTSAFASHNTGPAAAVIPIPGRLSAEEAATIPLAFLTAEWGLTHLARLQRGERVLIHAAAGGVGQAAVQLAMAIGAEVFATAGSDEKREYLRSQGVRHIFDSRRASFADDVLTATGGEGVDVVLNSLTGDMLQRSVDLLRHGGRFLELGKAEILDPATVAARRPGAKYFCYDLGSLLIETPDTFQELFRGMAARFASGALRCMRIRSYPAEEIVSAFRFMAQAKHIGKVVITSGTRPFTVDHPVIRPDASYVVTGASGGIGRSLVEWLVRRGAGRVVLNARSAPSGETQAWLDQLASSRTRLTWIAADVAREDDARRLLEQSGSDGLPVRGIFHAAGVLDDGLLLEQTRARFAGVFGPKISGAWNLHRATRGLDLDHFVLFSSVAAIMGGPGQGSYAASNAFLGSLAERRHRAGLPALAVDWGAWAGAGMAGRLSARERAMLEDRGLGFLDPATALQTLEGLMAGGDARSIVSAITWDRVRKTTRTTPPLLRSMLSSLAPAPSSPGSARATSVGFNPSELAGLDAAARKSRLLDYMRAVVGAVLGLRAGQLEADAEIGQFGFDSLMAMELRNRIETETGALVPVSRLLGSATAEALAGELDAMLISTTTPASKAAGKSSHTEGEI